MWDTIYRRQWWNSSKIFLSRRESWFRSMNLSMSYKIMGNLLHIDKTKNYERMFVLSREITVLFRTLPNKGVSSMPSHLGVFFVREWSTILNVHLLENVAFLSHSMTRPVGLVSLSYLSQIYFLPRSQFSFSWQFFSIIDHISRGLNISSSKSRISSSLNDLAASVSFPFVSTFASGTWQW